MNHKEILNRVKDKIEIHKQFKSAYNSQLAFDFNALNFFGIDENKVSQILAFFLDPNENHGQGKAFLKAFVEMFVEEPIEIPDHVTVNREKIISGRRRIDIFVSVGDFVIAVENKIWAEDQVNQLRAYSTCLQQLTNGRYLLLYLNPDGTDPDCKSLDDNTRKQLEESKHFKIISYRKDIQELLNKWVGVCEAENVAFFIKQFRKYLRTRFMNNNTLDMTNNLKPLILENQEAVEALLDAYQEMEIEASKKLDAFWKDRDIVVSGIHLDNISRSWHRPFNWEGQRVYKISLSKGVNMIYLQLMRKQIDIYLGYYCEKGTDQRFIEIVEQKKLCKREHLERDSSIQSIRAKFIEQVGKALKAFEEFEMVRV